MSKKIMTILLVVIMLIGGCGGSSQEKVVITTDENIEETTESLEEENKLESSDKISSSESLKEQTELLYPVIVGKTYYRYIPDSDTIIFINLFYDDFGSFTLSGFGYTAGVYDQSLALNEYFTPIIDGSTEYNSFNSYLNMGDGYFDLETSMEVDPKAIYCATFQLVTEEPDFDLYNGAPIKVDENDNADESKEDIVDLTVNETIDFFRDTNNIGKKFSCLMFYQGIREVDDSGITVPMYLFYWKHVNGISFSAIGKGVDENQIFFDGESVRVTGTYLEANPSSYYDFLISVDSMVPEEE